MPRRPAPPGVESDALAGRLRAGRSAEDLAAEIRAGEIGNAPSLPSDERLVRFIGIVGPTEVRAAIVVTLERLDRHSRGLANPVADPWDYLVAVVNGRPARLRHVYVLLYLWEVALRNRIDSVVGATRGDKWYLVPNAYLLERTALRIWQKHPELIGLDGKVVEQASAMAFLEKLFLWALHAIILDCWTAFSPNFRSHGTSLPHEEMAELLADIEQYRRETMHVRPMNNALFKDATTKLRTGLLLLGVNVDQALDRIGKRDPNDEDWHLFEDPGISVPPPASLGT